MPNPTPTSPGQPRGHAMRPTLAGTRHMIAAGHHMAAQAGFLILEAGGNAIDAGVAAGIAMGVLQSELVNVAGVAPIIIYLADRREVVTISGLGTWPKAATLELFLNEHAGQIPESLLRTVVPAAPDAWITALERYGTLSFGDVAAAAIRCARDGFPMYPLMARFIAEEQESYRRWDANAAIYLPGGTVPEIGKPFVQSDLARTLQFMVDEERRASGQGRVAGLAAARDAFYRGDIAKTICDYHAANGGLMTMADMAAFRVAVEPPTRTTFRGWDVYACGPWCQGPALLQALNILEEIDLVGLGHNSVDYVHVVAEAIKLAFADREHYYGDPRHVDVPMAALLEKGYAAQRRGLIRKDQAWPEMPPPGDPRQQAAILGGAAPVYGLRGVASPLRDTSYTCAVDRHGNVFSATPSDVAHEAPVIPGTGLCPSSRGSQSWAVPGHASAVAPGKRPRLTPNPALAIRDGRVFMPFGTPGGDIQVQAMVQAFVNVTVFGMGLQEAVEAPRFGSWSFPNSFEPHGYLSGKLNLERRYDPAIGDGLAARGHDVEWWPEVVWKAGSVSMIAADRESGVLFGAADPRRQAYALGW
ncbi:MAG: gamma-glutamyltransferase family protein [Alphaproteobacteria bacterium]|nr:gamma-glutamyltransferase family protein [Alphaproteobacteria bacterium]